MVFNHTVRDARTLFNDGGELHVHSNWTAASWHKHFILQVEHLLTPQSYVVCIIAKIMIAYLFVYCSFPPLLAHLVWAGSTEHLSVFLHLHQLSSGCRTEGSRFDLELI